MTIKILMIIPGMRSGGAERVMATLCNELSRKNQVRLVALKSADSDYELSTLVDFVGGNVKKQNIFDSVKIVSEQYSTWSPDVAVSFMTKANIVALLAKKHSTYKLPVIIAERANPYYAASYLKIFRKFLYPYADGAIFQTEQAKSYYNNILKCESAVLRNPLNSNFSVDTFPQKRRKAIVSVGRLSKEKNQKLLIESFSKIAHKFPEYIVEIYGEGPLKSELQRLIDVKHLNSQVQLMGRKKDIQKYIRDAEMFVLPSNSEGMPNSLLEAMALGLPSIATDCPIGGPAFIIDNKINGILVPMNDVDVLSANIENLINDNKLLTTLSKEARKVTTDFSSTVVCSQWEKYINRVALGNRKND